MRVGGGTRKGKERESKTNLANIATGQQYTASHDSSMHQPLGR